MVYPEFTEHLTMSAIEMLREMDGPDDRIREHADGVLDGLKQLYEAHEENFENNLDRDLQFLHPSLASCQYGVMHLTLLSIDAAEHFSPRFMLWFGKTSLPIKFRRLVYQGMTRYLALTLDSICHLVVLGYDNQARILLRSFLEVGELFLACLVDIEVFEFVTGSYRNSNTSVQEWRRVASVSKVRGHLKKAFIEFDSSGNISDFYEQFSSDLYNEMSEASHGRLLALVHSILRTEPDSDLLTPHYFAKRSTGGKKTLQLASQFMMFFDLAFPICIGRNHRGVHRESKRICRYDQRLATSIFGKGAFAVPDPKNEED